MEVVFFSTYFTYDAKNFFLVCLLDLDDSPFGLLVWCAPMSSMSNYTNLSQKLRANDAEGTGQTKTKLDNLENCNERYSQPKREGATERVQKADDVLKLFDLLNFLDRHFLVIHLDLF